MPRYVLGSELPERLRKLAKRKDTRRFTGEHRPRWLDSPSIDIARRNGPPDFKDDAEWLAHTEFPVSGKGDQLHLAKNGQQPRTHYLPKPEPSGDAPIELFLQPPPKFAPPPRAPRYMRGSSLPQDLQEQAKLTKAGQARYTREHRPAWLERPQLNGEPVLFWESDDDWLAHIEFAVVGNGENLRLHRGPYVPKIAPTFPDNPELRRKATDDDDLPPDQPINPNLAVVLARLVASRAGAPYWVKVQGYPVGELTPIMPKGADWLWRKVMPTGEVLPLR